MSPQLSHTPCTPLFKHFCCPWHDVLSFNCGGRACCLPLPHEAVPRLKLRNGESRDPLCVLGFLFPLFSCTEHVLKNLYNCSVISVRSCHGGSPRAPQPCGFLWWKYPIWVYFIMYLRLVHVAHLQKWESIPFVHRPPLIAFPGLLWGQSKPDFPKSSVGILPQSAGQTTCSCARDSEGWHIPKISCDSCPALPDSGF